MEFYVSEHIDKTPPNAIREISKLLQTPGMISFAGGNPSNNSLRNDYISGLAKQLLDENGKVLLQYGTTEGYGPLIESTIEFVKRAGVNAAKEQVLPVTGAMQGIDLMMHCLTDPGDVVLVESPTYLGTLHSINLRGIKAVPMPMDEEGVIPDEVERLVIEHKPRIIYVIPTFQNPTGKTIGVERRKQLAQIAAKYKTILLEDDPYRELRYSGEPLPSIKSFDESGYVVYALSYSKTISPGLRVGILIGENEILRPLIKRKQATDMHTPLLSQAIVDKYLRGGLLMEHIGESCKEYGRKAGLMIDGLKNMRFDFTHTTPQGGLFVWMELPESLDATKLVYTAIEKKVAFIPGAPFYCGGGHSNTMRLNFSNATDENIVIGMEKLAEVFNAAIK